MDDTLINTTELNNDAYNYALSKFGYPPINKITRITRNDLRNICNLQSVIEEKQNYFTLKWLPYRIITNNKLIDKLKQHQKSDCYIWTKADKVRAKAIWNACDLHRYFADIIFDKKENFTTSVSYLQHIFHDDMLIYENNIRFFHKSNAKLVDNVKNDYFKTNGYLIEISNLI